jgi:hypothetical protein
LSHIGIGIAEAASTVQGATFNAIRKAGEAAHFCREGIGGVAFDLAGREAHGKTYDYGNPDHRQLAFPGGESARASLDHAIHSDAAALGRKTKTPELARWPLWPNGTPESADRS